MHAAATRKERLFNYTSSPKATRDGIKELLTESTRYLSTGSIFPNEHSRVEMLKDLASDWNEVFSVCFCCTW
jgi:hypothetical protein